MNKKYTITLYKVVKYAKSTYEKYKVSKSTRPTGDKFHAFEIDAFKYDNSGRKLIGKFYNKFSDPVMFNFYLFCKEVEVIGTIEAKDFTYNKIFPYGHGASAVTSAMTELKKNGRTILLTDGLVKKFRRDCVDENIREAFTSRHFNKDACLPEDSFIVIELEAD